RQDAGSISASQITAGVASLNEVQSFAFSTAASGGTLTVSYGGQTTSALTAGISAAGFQSALEGLSSIGAGNVAVTGSTTAGFVLSLQGGLAATNIGAFTANTAQLAQNAGPISVVRTTPGAAAVNEVQTVSFSPTPTGGNFTLTLGDY